MAETLLVKCLRPSTDMERHLMTFVLLHLTTRWTLRKLLVLLQIIIKKNIQRAYYKQQLWVHAPFGDASLTTNAESCGYVRCGGLLMPETVLSKPEGLLDPCQCGKCACQNVCYHRVAGIKCCKLLQVQGK